jgi:hypothetical protein
VVLVVVGRPRLTIQTRADTVGIPHAPENVYCDPFGEYAFKKKTPSLVFYSITVFEIPLRLLFFVAIGGDGRTIDKYCI